MITATVNVDASWCPDTGAGGWAAWIAIDGQDKMKRSGKFRAAAPSSLVAEFWGMINGCHLAASAGARVLLVQGDCRPALANVLDGRQEAVRSLQALYPDIVLRTKWVKGHKLNGSARSWVNDWCDREAKKHMRLMRQELSCQ